MWARTSQHHKPHGDMANVRDVRRPRHAHVEAARALHVHEEGVGRLHKALQLMALQLKLPRRVQQINVAHRDARLRESREGTRALSKERTLPKTSRRGNAQAIAAESPAAVAAVQRQPPFRFRRRWRSQSMVPLPAACRPPTITAARAGHPSATRTMMSEEEKLATCKLRGSRSYRKCLYSQILEIDRVSQATLLTDVCGTQIQVTLLTIQVTLYSFGASPPVPARP